MFSVLVIFLVGCTRPSQGGEAPPIKADSDPKQSKGLEGCSFGGNFYDFDDMWNPDLGSPFGVMVCLQCVCDAVAKHGQLKGRVLCKNIKNECPLELPCENPVLPPGECCKRCPDEGEQEIASVETSHSGRNTQVHGDEKTMVGRTTGKEFLAVLTGSQVVPKVDAVGAARGHFLLVDDNVYFTIDYKAIRRPTKIRFSDVLNNTLFEHDIHKGHKGSHMICGEWRNLPRAHLRYFESGMILVSLVTRFHENGEVRGRIVSHRAAPTETFSSLILPKLKGKKTHDVRGSGGVVMMTVDEQRDSIDFVVLVEGLFDDLGTDEEVGVTIQFLKKSNVLMEKSATVRPEDRTFAEVWQRVNKNHQRWLARGQVSISIKFNLPSGKRFLEGDVTPLKTCSQLHAVLSGSGAWNGPEATGASGSVMLYLNDDGVLEYTVRVVGLRSPVTGLTLEAPHPRKRNKRRILDDIIRFYQNGWAYGRYEKPTAVDIHHLLMNKLSINVATEEYPVSELRGQIKHLLYNGHLSRHQGMPIPMAGVNFAPPLATSTAGHAWMSIDSRCTLHYEIVAEGLQRNDGGDKGNQLNGFAEIVVSDDTFAGEKTVLNTFDGSLARGTLSDLDQDLLDYLNDGKAFIQVSTKAHPEGEIRGQVTLPNACGRAPSLKEHLNNVPSVGFNVEADPRSCFFENKYHADGSSWSPEYDTQCTTCTCTRRAVICDPVVCPPVNCTSPVETAGECCPMCPPEQDLYSEMELPGSDLANEDCFFKGDKKYHALGSTWHPYVPPFGYIQCAICKCLPGNEVNCTKIKCPKLDCPDPVRLNAMDCCQTCPEKPKTQISEIQADWKEGSCYVNGVSYDNGQEWHPEMEIASAKTKRCIRCKCKDGETKCRRRKCPTPDCEEPIVVEGECCPICPDGVRNDQSSAGTT
uniref:Chordin n=1 Tax=Ptychodera flava TaxID=63121 RepID=G0Z836_PTYFL|nr:chordin [Ptychodera flava]